MGQSHSSSKHTAGEIDREKYQTAYHVLSAGQEALTLERFQCVLGRKLAERLWTFLMGSIDKTVIHRDEFMEVYDRLTGMMDRELVSLLLPVEFFLETCLESYGIEEINSSSDGEFITELGRLMTAKGSQTDEIVQWFAANGAEFLRPIRNKISAALSQPASGSSLSLAPQSQIISQTQMAIVQLFLPQLIYMKESKPWTCLFSSSHDGLSITKFENRVFDYKAATVSVFELSNGSVYVLANDEEWRSGLKNFGGPCVSLLQLRPEVKIFHLGQSPLYCNLKSRSQELGIKVGRGELSISENLSGVATVEVWGCSDGRTLDEQKKQKVLQKKHAERRGQVPLPGKWDENEDKAILEMAGHQFSAEKRD